MVELASLERVAAEEKTSRLAMIAKPGGPNTGVGRYVHMLLDHLGNTSIEARRVPPAMPPFPTTALSGLRKLGIDLPAFLSNYPVWANYPEADVYHFSSQNLASLLLARKPPGTAIVTVHDIIPYMLRNDADLCPYRGFADRAFDRLAMAGLKRADRLVADSHFTKRCLSTHLGIPAEQVDVVHLGIDHARFRPLDVNESTRLRYGLSTDQRYLIYVGSEDPRKNLEALLRALSIVRQERSDVALLKVGRAHFEQERTRLVNLATKLGISHAVQFLDDVPEDDLPSLYNLAHICVMPSLYEGFGFPVLEAMACGTPVICSNAASLPELVGDAALLIDPGPGAEKSMAQHISRILNDDDLRRALSHKGLDQAARFTWERSTSRMLDVYRETERASRGYRQAVQQ
ncbi:MAG: glycosyltransferase family 1 protein [Thermomicrobiaceae bacterium]